MHAYGGDRVRIKSVATVAPQQVPSLFSKLKVTLHAPTPPSTREVSKNSIDRLTNASGCETIQFHTSG